MLSLYTSWNLEEEWSYSPLILNFGTRRRWVVRFTPRHFNCEESASVSVESDTEWGSKFVWTGRRGEESLDHARNRTTFRRLSTPYSGLYIDHALKTLYIFCVVEAVSRNSDSKICDSSLRSIRSILLVYNSLATLDLMSLPLYLSRTELPESHNKTEYFITF
jgi:hypothetical protein